MGIDRRIFMRGEVAAGGAPPDALWRPLRGSLGMCAEWVLLPRICGCCAALAGCAARSSCDVLYCSCVHCAHAASLVHVVVESFCAREGRVFSDDIDLYP